MIARGPRPRLRSLSGALAVVGLLLAFASGAGPASAAGPTAAWLKLTSASTPTNLPPAGSGHECKGGSSECTVVVTATNLGTADVEADKTPLTITDELPAGMEVTGARPVSCDIEAPEIPVCGKKWPKEHTVQAFPKCSTTASQASCTFEETLAPYESWEMYITVKVLPGAGSSLTNTVTATGGKLETEPRHDAFTVSDDPTTFGVEDFELNPENEKGGNETQAGAHPFQFTTTLKLNTIYQEFPTKLIEPSVPEMPRNLHVNLPAGLTGNANKTIFPQCTELDFTTQPIGGINLCPEDTAVGVAVAKITEPVSLKSTTISAPVYNLVPAEGEPARFGFLAAIVPVTIDTAVHEGEYHVVANVINASAEPALISSVVTVWGVPGDERHDPSRGSQCLARGAKLRTGETCELLKNENPIPFLTLPTSCEQLQTSVAAQSWKFGATPLAPVSPISTETLGGCESLPFTPAMSIQPTQHESNTPSGLKVVLKVPQPNTTDPSSLAEANIRTTTVKLPAGVQLSPSAANGLQACSTGQIGYLGRNAQTHTPEFSFNEAELNLGEDELNEKGIGCPKASKVGTVEVKTPILEKPLHGSVYLAAENDNPFNSLFGIYIIVKDKTLGVLVKLAGEVKLDEHTGQITNIFPDAPQLPFQELTLELFSGQRASIATPRACGGYSSFTAFSPWSGTAPVEALLSPEEFNITAGPEGTGCASPQPFNPGVLAGNAPNTSKQAGAFTGFILSLTRADTDQQVSSLTTTLPPGLAGILKNVELCHEAEANAGTCGPGSLIGSATAVAGLGKDPFTVTGGRVYLTEKIQGTGPGAPFGLSVVIPAKAGPFDFGNVVTRARVEVDRNTAQVTVNTPEVPTMLNSVASSFPGCPSEHLHNGLCEVGTPVQLKRIDVTVDRPNFQFNPTNCSPLKITGTVGGDQGASAPISYPFQVTGCDKLPFSPELTAETSSKVTKVNGTSLVVKVKSSFGQANIGKTKIAFPEELPSRLTTIQKACRDTIFEVNPASCPEGSVIGMGIAHTPVLKNPLVGPIYLVSHGNTAFPDAEFVLQGEGITLVLDGKTDIKKGITTSEFNTVPDAPVELFEAILPAGPHSAFTGHGDLCKPTKPVLRKVTVKKRVKRGKRTRVVRVRKTVTVNVADPLRMPTILTGQNGNVIEKKTELKVSGCAKPKPKAKHHKKHSKKKKKKHKRKK
jgi:hypothetical protein